MSSMSKDIAKKVENIIIIVLLHMVLLTIILYGLYGNNLEVFNLKILKKTIETSGQCGENVFWELDDKQLIIKGSGPMENFCNKYDTSDEQKTKRIAPWIYEDTSSIEIKTIVIEPGVTSIGKNAFDGCWDVESVTIPDGIVTIEDKAFFCCFELSEIVIPASVTKIGDSAFVGCGLTDIIVPEGVEIIGNMAFSGCERLERLCLPSTVRKIGYAVIDDSDYLKKIKYSGTTVQWEKIDIDGFNEKLYQLDIECIDGIIKS